MMMVESLASLLRPRKDLAMSSSKGSSTMSVGSIGSSIRLQKSKKCLPRTTRNGRKTNGGEDKESVVSATTATATTLTSTGSIGTNAKTSKVGMGGHRRRRRVQFLFDEYDDVQATVIDSELEFTDDEWENCFMVNADLRQNRKLAVRNAAMYGRKNQLYVDVLQSLFRSPLKAAAPPAGARRVGSSRDVDAASPDSGVDLRPALVMDDAEILRVIGECPERGLEHVMYRDALMMRHKQYVINAVLHRNEQLRRAGAHQGQPGKVRDARTEVLARFCSALTASSQELAVRLAQADELQAKAIYNETLQ